MIVVAHALLGGRENGGVGMSLSDVIVTVDVVVVARVVAFGVG